jgi:L-alanine-DL-glutamate epimerase-like enolase superfamily enzyme
MKLTFQPYDLRLRHTFTISRGSRDVEPSVITAIEHDGITGYGEAAPTPRYGESRESVAAFLGRVDLSPFQDPFALDPILAAVDAIAPGNTAAKASVDIALHDWIGRRLGQPLWKLWGLDPTRRLTTSFTIGIDALPVIEQKVKEAAAYPILKVKVGIPNDEEIITTIRAMTDKPIRVDANEGWTSKELARDKILWLEERGVEFIEQPMPAAQLDDIAWLREHVHIPIIADESVKGLDDIPRLAGAFDGINIKLMKSRGLREAVRMIHAAQAMGMSVMLGCMIESSVGISAAAQLAPLAQYADLDGNVLITNDPFSGVTLQGGTLVLGDMPGLGVTPR